MAMTSSKQSTAESDGKVDDQPVSPPSTNETTMPPRFSELKQRLIPNDTARQHLVSGWRNLLAELQEFNEYIKEQRQDMIPQVSYSDFISSREGSPLLEEIKKRGVVVIRGVVPSKDASQWKEAVKSYVTANPSVTGYPADDPQIFELYWTPTQIAARAHPSFLATATRLNTIFYAPPEAVVSLETPVTYADRLRIRHPGDGTFVLGPHIDSGGTERWEDEEYSRVYQAILDGKWAEYDAYDLTHRLNAKSNLYGTPNGCSLFRTFQGWLSMSTTGPNEGTLRVYPSIRHSTAYTILRPFFRPISPPALPASESTQAAFLHPDNWELNLDSPEFPGSHPGRGQKLSDTTHPHLELKRTMISMPKVEPGDAVFWTSDSVHSVEENHAGKEDSAVLYIPAVPLTVPNAAYLARQRDTFIAGVPGPDFPKGPGESDHANRGRPELILNTEGKRAMGLLAFEAVNGISDGARQAVQEANKLLAVA